MENNRLTDEKYWESRFNKKKESDDNRSFFGKIFDKYFYKIKRGFPEYQLYEIICQKYFPDEKLKLLEIGSAPGEKLKYINEIFGYEPFGVEYIESGVKLNRDLFRKCGLNENNVIHADLFDPEFLKEYEQKFDIVMSHGFIEHFTNTTEVIDSHLKLLKPKGLLLITVPNFRGINYLLLSFFAPKAIKAHNISIMKKSKYMSLFDNNVDILLCRYYGIFNFGLVYGTNKPPIKLFLMKICMFLQRIFDVIFYILIRKISLDSSLSSPYLMMLARKR